MRRIFAILGVCFLGSAALAADGAVTDGTIVEQWSADPTQVFEANDITLSDLLWVARPVVIFADTAADPAFTRQLDLLRARVDELVVRDVILIADTTRDEPSELRRKLRPRGFQLALIGKDGGVKLRKPFPWDVRELTRQIDKIPLRQQEIRDALRVVE